MEGTTGNIPYDQKPLLEPRIHGSKPIGPGTKFHSRTGSQPRKIENFGPK